MPRWMQILLLTQIFSAAFFSDGEVGKEAIGGPRQLPVPSHWVERALPIPSS